MRTVDVIGRCGHDIKWGMVDASGYVPDDIWDENIAWAKDKLCLLCFNKLPDEEKRKLTKESIEWEKRLDAARSQKEKQIQSARKKRWSGIP